VSKISLKTSGYIFSFVFGSGKVRMYSLKLSSMSLMFTFVPQMVVRSTVKGAAVDVVKNVTKENRYHRSSLDLVVHCP
jgi:hypothetical protein